MRLGPDDAPAFGCLQAALDERRTVEVAPKPLQHPCRKMPAAVTFE